MDVKQFFQEILKSQELNQDQITELESHRDEIEGVLRAEFGEEPVIRYAGSLAKGTMIADSYDLDIACYFPNDCGMTIKEVYTNALEVLQQNYVIEPKTSAIRIKSLNGGGSPVDYHIDVVPGRFIDDGKDVFLYLSGTEGERIQTNLKTHIRHIKDSGHAEIIKLMKLWKVRNRLSFRTFVLELLVIYALQDSSATDIADKVQIVLQCIKEKIVDIRLEDPANSQNVVSNLLTIDEKKHIANLANNAIEQLNSAKTEEDKVKAWGEFFGKQRVSVSALSTTPLVIKGKLLKPWCNV